MDYLELYFGICMRLFIIKQRIFQYHHNPVWGRQVYPERNSVNPAGYGIRRDIHSVDRAEKSDSSCYDKRTEQQRGYFVTLWRFPLRPSVGKNLPESDTEGCILGASLAEQLFGGTEVEGQQILYNGRELTVRGIVKEPTKYNAMSERCKR